MISTRLADVTDYPSWIVQRRCKKYVVIELTLVNALVFTEIKKQLMLQFPKGYLIKNRHYFRVIHNVYLCIRPPKRIAIIFADFPHSKVAVNFNREDPYIKQMIAKIRPALCSCCSSIEITNITIETSSINPMGENII